jgi:hypothetical protein
MFTLDLSSDELEAMLTGATWVPEPPCFYANKIGDMARAGNVAMQYALSRLLVYDDVAVRFAAYCHGCAVERPILPLQRALRMFARDPENAEVVRRCQEQSVRH